MDSPLRELPEFVSPSFHVGKMAALAWTGEALYNPRRRRPTRMEEFVHLFCCSRYSMSRGAFSTGELVQAAARHGASAVALTDRRGLYGAIPFFRHARRAGIRPIFGAIFPTPTPGASLVALARHERGFRNLCRLITADQLARPKHPPAKSPDRPPPTLIEIVERHAEGLIFLTSDPDYLERLRPRLSNDSLYAELFLDDTRQSRQLIRRLLPLAEKLGLRTAATNRVHFLDDAGYERHRLLSAIRLKKTLETLAPHIDHMSPSCRLARADQMRQRFADLPSDALRATVDIAQACDVDLPLGQKRMPRFDPATLFPDRPDASCETLLGELCQPALERRYPTAQGRAVARARLAHELDIICSMGYAPYFLVVWDIVEFARRRRIPLTGRGSAADSLVSYLLGCTHVDPIAHNLYFERFLNRERSSPPDIDLDLCWRRRDHVVDYVYERWGGPQADRVAMISTHVTYAGRSRVREAGKAIGMSESEMSRITRLLPHYGPLDFERLRRDRPESKGLDLASEPMRTIVPLARSIEGYPSHLGVHPSGIVVAPGALTDWTPLERAAKGLVVTQYDMYPIEELGLLKIDLLGQRSLSVIADVCSEAALEIENIDTEHDLPTQELIASGRTLGVFQIESPGIRGVLRKVQARDFETVTACSSVIRPGPKDAGMLRSWVRRHTGREPTRFLHPRLEETLGDTHGIMIYQEDVMRVLQAVAGLSLGQADMMRRAMSGKRSEKKIEDLEEEFLEGARRGGVDPVASAEIWRQMRAFAGYAFCKAHSASYTVLSFRSAWLKVHYPAEFIGAVLANGGGFYDRAAYVSEARRMGIGLRLPSIDQSDARWHGARGEIRCGLNQIKNLRRSAIQDILDERQRAGPFRSFRDALTRLPTVEKTEWDQLILCGACDRFQEEDAGFARPRLLWRLDRWFASRRGSAARQLDLFDIAQDAAPADAADEPNLPPFSFERLHDDETRILEVAIRCHPLGRYRALLPDPSGILPANRLAERAGARARLVGWLVTSRRLRTTKGAPMKFLTLEDETDIYEAILFEQAYRRYGQLSVTRGPYAIEGRVDEEDGHCSLNIDRLELLRP